MSGLGGISIRGAVVVPALLLIAVTSCADDPAGTANADTETTTSVAAAVTVPASAVEGVYGPDVEAFDLELDEVSASAPPGPLYMSAGGGSLWVGLHRAHAVDRVDPETGAAIDRIAIDPAAAEPTRADEVESMGAGAGTGSLVATDDGVWVLDQAGFVWRIDPASGDVVARIEVPGLLAESGVAIGHGSVWVRTNTGYARIDPELSDVTATDLPNLDPPANGPQMNADADAVWMGVPGGSIRVGADDGSVTGPFPFVVAGVDDGVPWAITTHEAVRVDAVTGEVTQSIPAPATLGALLFDSVAMGDGAVWAVALPPGNTMGPEQFYELVRFDLQAGTASHQALMNAELDFTIGLAATDAKAWAADFGRGNLLSTDAR